jgi:WD40 repeat protein
MVDASHDMPYMYLLYLSIAIVLASVTTNAQKENELLACSYDSVVLTSVLSQKPLESFRQAWNDKLLMKSRSDGSYGCSYTSIAFGVKSRYLCLGDTSGDVSLLDLKKSCVVVRQYPSSDGLACRQASLDPTESFVIVLSRETLSIFQLREGALLHRFSVYDDTSGSLSFTNFHVSPFRQLPSMIAVGTDQGCIQVLDIANSFQKTTATPADEPWQPRFTLTNAPSHTRRGRITSPVVGIAFSAQVKPLLVSISRHGYLSFNDVDLGHHIEQRQVAERVVTSLTYHQDGNILALGTDDGRVAIYDIRNLNDPISTYKMGDAVTCVKFAPAVVVVPVTHNDNNTSSISNSTAGRVDQTDTPTRSNVSPPKIALPPPVQLPSMTALVSSDTEHRDQAEPRESIEEQGSAVDMVRQQTIYSCICHPRCPRV